MAYDYGYLLPRQTSDGKVYRHCYTAGACTVGFVYMVNFTTLGQVATTPVASSAVGYTGHVGICMTATTAAGFTWLQTGGLLPTGGVFGNTSALSCTGSTAGDIMVITTAGAVSFTSCSAGGGSRSNGFGILLTSGTTLQLSALIFDKQILVRGTTV